MNISKDLFEKIPTQLSVLKLPENIGWSDWGEEERILKTLKRYGRILGENGCHIQQDIQNAN